MDKIVLKFIDADDVTVREETVDKNNLLFFLNALPKPTFPPFVLKSIEQSKTILIEQKGLGKDAIKSYYSLSAEDMQTEDGLSRKWHTINLAENELLWSLINLISCFKQ